MCKNLEKKLTKLK